MKLQIKKPIVFFDLETTGLNLMVDRIVEISYIKVNSNGEKKEVTYRVNPEMHIPEEATAVHHISDAEVAKEKTFKELAQTIANEFRGCDFGGFNSNRFDVPMLDQEFQRANVDFDFSKARFIDVQTIFHKKEPRNLVAAYKFYCGKDLDGAHSANADTSATYEVLLAQLEKYDDLPTDVEKLAEYSSQNRNVDFVGRLVRNDKNEIIVNFGKYKGRVAKDVLKTDPGYYNWIMQGDFTKNTKDCFTNIKLGKLE